jgi:hypothetical protein
MISFPNQEREVCCVVRGQRPIYCDKSTCDPEQTGGLNFPFRPYLSGRKSAGKKRGFGLPRPPSNGGKSIRNVNPQLAQFFMPRLKLRERFRNPRIIVATGRYPPSPARGRPIRGAIDNFVGCASFFCAA